MDAPTVDNFIAQNGLELRSELRGKKKVKIRNGEELVMGLGSNQRRVRDYHRYHQFRRMTVQMRHRLSLKQGPEVQFPGRLEQLKKAFLCPPHGRVAYDITKLLGVICVWLAIITLLKKQALPGGNFWGLCIVIMSAMIGEEITKKLQLPSLLGMIVAGFILQNVPHINVATLIDPGWSAALRSIALVIILLRAGIGLDLVVLRRLAKSVALVTFVPSTIESVTGAVVAHFLLGFEWGWSFCLGFLLCGVSPAVLVPSMLEMQEDGLGVDKGLPTLLMASASIENVYVIVAMSVLTSAEFIPGGVGMKIAIAPIELAIGGAYGCGAGFLLWYFPDNNHPDRVDYRFVLLMTAGITAVFGANAIGYGGAGPLACLLMPFIAAQRWSRTDNLNLKILSLRFRRVWWVYQPILFGLIGAAVSLSKVRPETIGYSVAVILIGSFVRFFVTLFSVTWAGFNWKERLFTAIAWIPKATVQAALGSVVYDNAAQLLVSSPDDKWLLHVQDVGTQILTTAVLCIVITAPIGALGITFTKERFLNRSVQHVLDDVVVQSDSPDGRGSASADGGRSAGPDAQYLYNVGDSRNSATEMPWSDSVASAVTENESTPEEDKPAPLASIHHI